MCACCMCAHIVGVLCGAHCVCARVVCGCVWHVCVLCVHYVCALCVCCIHVHLVGGWVGECILCVCVHTERMYTCYTQGSCEETYFLNFLNSQVCECGRHQKLTGEEVCRPQRAVNMGRVLPFVSLFFPARTGCTRES